MKIAVIIARILLGLVFFGFGLIFFIPVVHMPPPPKGPGGDFFTLLYTTHYMHAVKCFEVVGGFLLLIGKKVPLALTLLGPVVVNILFYDIFLDRSGLGMGIVVSAFALFLLWAYRSAFAGIVKQ